MVDGRAIIDGMRLHVFDNVRTSNDAFNMRIPVHKYVRSGYQYNYNTFWHNQWKRRRKRDRECLSTHIPYPM